LKSIIVDEIQNTQDWVDEVGVDGGEGGWRTQRRKKDLKKMKRRQGKVVPKVEI